MKLIFLAPVLLATAAWANDSADLISIDHTIAQLNEPATRSAAFAPGANAQAEYARIVNAMPLPLPTAPGQAGSQPTVVISHEPWGEATVVMNPGADLTPPKIESGPIQFLNRDVALVEGSAHFVSRLAGVRVLFVMLREGPEWKIGSLRILMPRVGIAK